MLHLGPQRQLKLLILLALVKKIKINNLKNQLIQEAYLEIKLKPLSLRDLSPLYIPILGGTLLQLFISNKGKGKFTSTKGMI